MVCKRPTEGGLEAFAVCLWLSLWALAWVLPFGLLLLAFWCGKLLEAKRITEGKRIAEAKRMAKEGLIESLHEKFNIGLRKACAHSPIPLLYLPLI
jgi:hypothetical protein